ncbi:MAG: RNA polymerase sigma-70 factor [Ferruginibacter sp.]
MIQQNNIKEFEQFFNEYYIPAVRYCATMVKDMDDAEDIVQQVFIGLWNKREVIKIHTSARAYLYKTVYNAGLDFLKHEKVKAIHQRETITNNQEGLYSDSTITNELRQKIEKEISELPEQCGKIFKMCKIENLKYREVASELNISEKTVEKQMGKALKLLRESLREYLPLFLILLNCLR